MPRQPKTQHRQPRESRTSRETIDVKRENNRLKREVARLRRQLEKQLEESPVDDAEPAVEQKLEQKPACSACGSTKEPTVWRTPSGKNVSACVDCKAITKETDIEKS